MKRIKKYFCLLFVAMLFFPALATAQSNIPLAPATAPADARLMINTRDTRTGATVVQTVDGTIRIIQPNSSTQPWYRASASASLVSDKTGQYVVRVLVEKLTPGGQPEVISRPMILMSDGNVATVEVGQREGSGIKVDIIKPLNIDAATVVTTILDEGRVRWVDTEKVVIARPDGNVISRPPSPIPALPTEPTTQPGADRSTPMRRISPNPSAPAPIQP